jgi:predicted amidohydrolase
MRVAIAQARPALLDLDRGVELACRWIARAGGEGVELLAFGETFLGGYPVWVDWPGWSTFGSEANAALYERQRRASLALDSGQRRALAAACREARVAVSIGASERSAAGKSIYNSLLLFDRDGTLLQVRRKLVPTHGERLCWAPAPDRRAASLQAVDVGEARVGALLCWEHWMPAARLALHRAGESLHVAAWPHGSELHQLASRHYAFEGSCFVLLAATWLPREDLVELGLEPPAGFAGLEGGSAVIAPDAEYVLEPVRGREELLIADLDLGRAERAAFYLDTGGHSDRPDLDDDERPADA